MTQAERKIQTSIAGLNDDKLIELLQYTRKQKQENPFERNTNLVWIYTVAETQKRGLSIW